MTPEAHEKAPLRQAKTSWILVATLEQSRCYFQIRSELPANSWLQKGPPW
jgi:hypothetical protein